MYISAPSSLLPISTTNTETRILSSAFATSSCSGRRRFSGNKNVPKSKFRDDPRGSKSPRRCFPTSASASSSSSQDSTMAPIQLQDVARKQFENRERSRAQMVRHPRLLFLSFRLCLTERGCLGKLSDSARKFFFFRWNGGYKRFDRELSNRRDERKRRLINQRRIFLAQE